MRAPPIPLPALLLLAPLLAAAAPQHKPEHKPAPSKHAEAAKHPEPAKAAGPKAIGSFESWTAATLEGGQVCYAFTRASHSTSSPPGRGDVVLTVTQRPNLRDAVAISAGYAYPANANVQVQVDQTALEFYTSGHSAFARDGHAAVTAFGRGSKATARGPGPKNTTVVDDFSLSGFSKAYEAINKACPAK